MKKICIALAACATLGTSFTATAADHSVTLGYAESKFTNDKLKGLNLKYRFEWDSPVSVITSMTYMSYSEKGTKYPTKGDYTRVNYDGKIKNYSLAAGPAYRLSPYFSIYGLMGININHTSLGLKGYNDQTRTMGEGNLFTRTTNMMYGAGIQVNPMANLVLDIGYEGSQSETIVNKRKAKLNGFNIGAGYRF